MSPALLAWMGLAAALGAVAVLAWQRLARRRGDDATPGGCIAVLIVDGPKGALDGTLSQDAPRRLRDRIEDTLRRALPPGALLQRCDIDRFVLTTPDPDLAILVEALDGMRHAVAHTYLAVAGGTILCTLSAGAVRVRPGETRADVMIRASEVTARARARGGDRVVTEDGQPGGPADALRDNIAEALADGALCYDLQPIHDLRSGRDIGAEALLRWPGAGVQGADDAGVIDPAHLSDLLDRLPEAGASSHLPRRLAEAAEPVLAQPGTFVTLNISGAVLDGAGSGSCAWLDATLDLLPPERVIVEIVEHAVVTRPERAVALMARLRARGVRVALDDFGTGLSNLDRLRLLPVDLLKLDRAFVRGLGGAGREETILRHLCAMANELMIELIAEGVETEAQAAALRALGIRYAQGYHFGRPMPAAAWAARDRGDRPTD